MPGLLVMLSQEIEDCRKTFNIFRRRIEADDGKPCPMENMPALSSQIKFISELKKKITTNMKLFKNMKNPIIYSTQSRELWRKYDQLKDDLARYEREIYEEWLSRAEKVTVRGVKTSLIIRNSKTGTLRVNFDRETMEILTDVKYITREARTLEVPSSVLEIFQHFDHFKNVDSILSDVAERYNYLKTSTAEIEFRLIEEEVGEIDTILRPAESTFNWMSPDTESYALDLLTVVTEINERVKEAQDNVITIYREISKWETVPLLSGVQFPRDKEVRQERKVERYDGLRSAGKRVQKLVKKNRNIFDIDLQSSTGARRWTNYLQYVDRIVRDSVIQTVAVREHLKWFILLL